MAAVISSSVLTPNRYSFLERFNGTRANIESRTTIGAGQALEPGLYGTRLRIPAAKSVLYSASHHVGELITGEGRDNEVKRASGDRLQVEPDVRQPSHDDDVYGLFCFDRQAHDVLPGAVRQLGLGENQVRWVRPREQRQSFLATPQGAHLHRLGFESQFQRVQRVSEFVQEQCRDFFGDRMSCGPQGRIPTVLEMLVGRR